MIFVYAAVLAAISGFLYAHLQRAVNPTPFGLNHGIEFLFMAVVGGVAHVWGVVLITVLQYYLQTLLSKLLGSEGNFEVIVFGVLLAEHDMDFVMNFTDRLVVMAFGTRIAEGLPQEVQQDPAVLEAYLGGVE